MLTQEQKPLPKTPENHMLWFEFSSLSLMLAETCLVTAWYGALVSPDPSWLFCGLLLGMIYIGSHYLSRLMEMLNWSESFRRVVLVIWILFCLSYTAQYLLYPAESLNVFKLLLRPITDLVIVETGMQGFWHMILIALPIWRGVALASRSVDEETSRKSLRLGLLLFLVYGVFHAAIKPLTVLSMIISAYLFFSLASLSAASIGELGKLRGGRLPRFTPARFAGILGGTLLVVTAALAAGWVISIDQITSAITHTVIFIFIGITLAFTLLLSPLLSLIVWLASKMPQLEDFPLDMESTSESLFEEVETITAGSIDTQDLLSSLGRPLLLALILGVIIISALISLRFRAHRRKMAAEEQTSQITARKGMRFLPQNIPTPDRITRVLNLRKLWNAARIRYVYARLIDLSSRLGTKRKAAATPLEFQPKLEQLFPQQSHDLACITQAYIKVRYGEIPETDFEVQKVMQAWEHIQAQGKLKLHEIRRLRRK